MRAQPFELVVRGLSGQSRQDGRLLCDQVVQVAAQQSKSHSRSGRTPGRTCARTRTRTHAHARTAPERPVFVRGIRTHEHASHIHSVSTNSSTTLASRHASRNRTVDAVAVARPHIMRVMRACPTLQHASAPQTDRRRCLRDHQPTPLAPPHNMMHCTLLTPGRFAARCPRTSTTWHCACSIPS